jgi:hypothetical protein
LVIFGKGKFKTETDTDLVGLPTVGYQNRRFGSVGLDPKPTETSHAKKIHFFPYFKPKKDNSTHLKVIQSQSKLSYNPIEVKLQYNPIEMFKGNQNVYNPKCFSILQVHLSTNSILQMAGEEIT